MLKRLAMLFALVLMGVSFSPGVTQAQADCPKTAQDSVTLATQAIPIVLVGNVLISPQEVVILPVTPKGQTAVNVRAQPSAQGAVVGSIQLSGSLNADGRLADRSWLRVQLTGGGVGWVSASVSKVTGDVSTLAVRAATDATPPRGNGFDLTNSSSTDCASAPNGVLIQTPDGTDTLSLNVSGVSFTLNKATAFVTSDAQGLGIAALEGTITVQAGSHSTTVYPGTETHVALDASGAVSGSPTALAGYDSTLIAQLPTTQLARAITPVSSLTADQINTLESTSTAGNYLFAIDTSAGYACPSGGISPDEVVTEGKTLIQHVPPWTTAVSYGQSGASATPEATASASATPELSANNASSMSLTVIDYGRTNPVTLAQTSAGHYEYLHTVNGSRVGYKVDVLSPTMLKLTLVFTYQVSVTTNGVASGGRACNDFELYLDGTLQS